MKKISLVFAASLLFSFTAQAETIIDTLANLKTNHLQLLANNLNMLMITEGDEALQKAEFVKGIAMESLRFSASGDSSFGTMTNNALKSTFTFSATVSKVTNAECATLAQVSKTMFATPNIQEIISEASFYKLSDEQLQQITRSTIVYATIIATENNSLKITCQ